MVRGFAPGAGADDRSLVLWTWGDAAPSRLAVAARSGRRSPVLQGAELPGEHANGRRVHHRCNALLGLTPVRQRGLDRVLAGRRQMRHALALVGLADLDPDETTPLQRIEVAPHGGAVQRNLSREARDGEGTEAGERAQHGKLGNAKTRGRQSSIIGGRDRTCGASEGAADARCIG